MTLFHGLAAFPITPAAPDGEIDADGVRALTRRLVDAGVDSIGLLGSTGAYPFFRPDQRRRAVEAAVAEAAGAVPVMVGIGALRTDDVLRLGHDAEAAGADALLLAPVSYTPLTDREVCGLFETVAAEMTRPVAIYHNPGTTHFTFGEDLIARLSELPLVRALKNPLPASGTIADELARLRSRTPDGFAIGYSGDWGCVEALLAGADAWYSVVAGLFPEVCVALTGAATAGDARAARAGNDALAPLWDLFRELGSIRVMYAAANIRGISRAQPPLPILPLAERDRQRVHDTLDRLDLR